MDGDFAASLWEGREFWMTLALPSILFAFVFIAMIWGLFKKAYRKPIWVVVFILTMLLFLIGANSIRYIAVELVRAGHIGLLERINDVLSVNLYILGAISLVIFFYNRNQWAGLPLIATLTFSAVTRYSLWLVNLLVWYGQAYF